MAVTASRVTVTTTATLVVTADADGQSILISPAGDVYLGASDVTTATGFLVSSGSAVSLDLAASERLYGIVAAGTVEVSILGNRQ